ncbi:hypothetical protein HK099_003451 [Clydaea vesicula]|uniref:Glycosyltransferase-like protein n=1 Tax=Clydaea vesicula TaxID=447962 RepID=A0AAD5U217_9FUNG|nr:hypothetical protein HK099_003451 [Clydaea vesicula]KAJ3384747.1 hypothetical protein HDU92_003433 [Lobulomyces angularis]
MARNKRTKKESLRKFSEKRIFDKMFATVLKPTDLKPYFFKMKRQPRNDEISITTLITVDRFDTLLNSMKTFDGPYSVTLHIFDDEFLQENLDKLNNFLIINLKTIENRLDLHLIVDKFTRQLNYFRNVARFFSRTDILLPLDVDFIVNKNFIPNLKSNDFVQRKLRSGKGIFILPAFEYQDEWVNTTFDRFPQTKAEVISQFGTNLTIFHGRRNKGHTSTRYSKWLTSTDVYPIRPDTIRYEPYAIFNKTYVPWSDERFTGYGGNKAAWWYEIYLSGLEFWVLPYDFVIHIYHGYPEVRDNERIKNTPIILNFVSEICSRYKTMFLRKEEEKDLEELQEFEMMGCYEKLKRIP